MARITKEDVVQTYNEFKEGTNLPDISVLDQHFYFTNGFMNGDYLSVKFGVQSCDNITSFFKSWNGYLHEIMIPNPNNMISINEHNMFSEEERNEINIMLTKVIAHIARNTAMVVQSTKEEQVQYILDSITFWENEYKPKLEWMTTKIRDTWHTQATEKK